MGHPIGLDSLVIAGTLLTVTLAIIALTTFVAMKARGRGRLPESHLAPTLEALIPDSRFIDVDGVKLHYIQAGEGSDVVLLHGIGASVYVWRFLFPILQLRHRVTAIDIAGFGKSAKEPTRDYGLDAQTQLLCRATKSLGIEKSFLVGSSMGGAIALWMARTCPDVFEKVAVLGPATNSRLVLPFTHKLAPLAPFFRGTLTRPTMRLLLGQVLTKKELITDEVIDAYLEPFRDGGSAVRSFMAATSLLADRRLPGELREVKSKVLVLYGDRDFSVTRKSIDRLEQILDDGELVVHPEAGHHIMEDEPTWVAKQLEIFFAK